MSHSSQCLTERNFLFFSLFASKSVHRCTEHTKPQTHLCFSMMMKSVCRHHSSKRKQQNTKQAKSNKKKKKKKSNKKNTKSLTCSTSSAFSVLPLSKKRNKALKRTKKSKNLQHSCINLEGLPSISSIGFVVIL